MADALHVVRDIRLGADYEISQQLLRSSMFIIRPSRLVLFLIGLIDIGKYYIQDIYTKFDSSNISTYYIILPLVHGHVYIAALRNS